VIFSVGSIFYFRQLVVKDLLEKNNTEKNTYKALTYEETNKEDFFTQISTVAAEAFMMSG